MASLKFTSDLETGIRGIDEQHREIFAWGEAVLERPETLANPKEFVRLYQFLASYVRFHFASEEEVMRRYEYERLESHQKQHRRFRNELAQLYDRARAEGPSKEIRLRTHFVIADWFVYHIKEVDKQLSATVRTRIQEEEGTLPNIQEMRDAGIDVEGLLETPVRVVRSAANQNSQADRIREKNR